MVTKGGTNSAVSSDPESLVSVAVPGLGVVSLLPPPVPPDDPPPGLVGGGSSGTHFSDQSQF